MTFKELLFDKKLVNGVFSVCSANSFVIRASIKKAKQHHIPILIESTANQVNQNGGYTNMNPEMFKEYVFDIASSEDYPLELVFLGGDHLGPLTWKELPEAEAMGFAEELVEAYVKAGFNKIHIDTSMKLGDDDKSRPLNDATIAKRTVRLLQRTEAYAGDDVAYIVGSEVPTPGGATTEEETLKVTSVKDVKQTLKHLYEELERNNLGYLREKIVGLVVQPGVEFGDDEVHHYNRNDAKELMNFIHTLPNLVFEGHSTDYQTKEGLRELIEDGVEILKVGPALTFYFREATYSLELIEKEFHFEKKSNIRAVYEKAMMENPGKWIDYYLGDESTKRLKRHFSFSDRIRYYGNRKEVKESFQLLLKNLKSVDIPLSLIAQYFPNQYDKIIHKEFKADPESLIFGKIGDVLEDYIYAVKKH